MRGFKALLGLLVCAIAVPALEIKSSDIDKYIVGGRAARRGQFSYLVALRISRNNRHQCGGSILSERWIVSAAHCTENSNRNPSNVHIVTEAHTLTDGTRYNLSRIVNHPRFERSILRFDVSLLQTDAPIRMGPRVRPIQFATGPLIAVNDTCVVAGWGLIAVCCRSIFSTI